MIIDDLIILGRACPEQIKDGRITVCSGGYSHKLGFVRIYPTRTKMPWRQWDIVRVEVEKDLRDTRVESWKIAGSKSDWENLAEKVEVAGHLPQSEWMNLVTNLADGCIQEINDKKRSLGIIKPTVLERFFTHNPHYGVIFQPLLPTLSEKTAVKRDFEFEPRVKYKCQMCKSKKPHNQQILEWGFYEWLRKNPEKKEQVWKNALFDSPKHEIFFFVGNQFMHRRSFIVISVLRVPKGSIQLPLELFKK
jgi:hypothetical protein